MRLINERRQYITIRRKGLVHVVGLAVLSAVLACNLSTAGQAAPTETPVPETTVEEQATDAPTPTKAVGQEAQDAAPVVRTTADLVVRSGPDVNCEEIGLFANDTAVEVLAKDPSGEWWQVNYEDNVGWMSATYTTPLTDLSGVQAVPGPACEAPTATSTNTSIPPTATATSMPTATATATSGPSCGNGIKEAGEACDGSNEGCGIAQFCNDSCQCQILVIQTNPVCGNGVKEAGEACDGSNQGCGIAQFCNDSCQCQVFQISPGG